MSELIEIREAADGTAWELSGLATTWDSPYEVSDRHGRYRESIARGAFAGAVSGSDVIALNVQHSRDASPLASTRGGSLAFSDENRGLALRAVLPKDEGDVRDAVGKVRRGVLSGLSVGMRVTDDDWTQNGTRRVIRAARLFEVSLVHEQSNPGAVVTSVRGQEPGAVEVRFVGDLAIVDRRAGGAGRYTPAQLVALGKAGKAYRHPDGSYGFPVADREDLKAAIGAVGASGQKSPPATVRRFIMARARSLGLSQMIPATWRPDGTLTAERSGASIREIRRELAAWDLEKLYPGEKPKPSGLSARKIRRELGGG